MENINKFKNHAAELFEKYQSGTLSEEEHALLHSWFRTYTDPSVENIKLSDEELAEMHEQLLKRFKDREPSLLKKIIPLIAAACIFIALATSLYLYFYKAPQDHMNNALANDVQPGGSRAYWITEEGETFNLTTDINNHSIATIDQELGIIIFSPDNTLTGDVVPKQQTITTPIGGEYTVILSDGSTVKLNSNSSLTFTHPFRDSREVTLWGEGYFEVAHNPSKPFFVNTSYQHIQVLGTTFNIKSYKEDQQTTTTLVSGKLRVAENDLADATSFILSPGETAQSGKNQTLTVQRSQKLKTVAWQKGEFQFDGESLEEVLQILSRWYDVDVSYQRTSPTKVRFGGAISRNRNLSDVLNILTAQEDFTYEIRGRQVIIK